MKVAFVFDDSLDAPDGVQQYILTLSREYVRRGINVHFLVGETHRSDIDNVHSLAKNFGVKFNQNRMRIPLLANSAKIRDILSREKFDVLHVQVPFSPMLASKVILNAPAKTKIVGTFHIAPHSRIVSAGNRALGVLTARELKRFDVMTSVSDVAKTFAKKSFGVDSIVVPNPVELDRFAKAAKSRQSNNAKTILFLGRLVERKGCQYLLNAVDFAEKSGVEIPAKIVVAGDGPLRGELEKFAKSLKTPIEFRGFIDETDKPELLTHADVAVFPSTGGESFGIVLTEAMAAGAGVVLAGDNPGYRSTMANYDDVLFDPIDPKIFAKALSRALTDEKFIAKTHTWQQNHVEQFDVRNVADELIKLYKA